MSEASTVAQYQDLKRLRDAAAWKLLGADTAPLICTSLLSLFPTTGSRQLSAAVLHAKMDLVLEGLRSAGVEPTQSAQGYASDWVSNGWLRRDFPQGAQEEHYSLTVAAGSALRIVDGWRPNVTDGAGGVRLESRLASVRSLMRELDHLTDDNQTAFVRQVAQHGETDIPILLRRQPLTFLQSAGLLILRAALASSSAAGQRAVVGGAELIADLAAYEDPAKSDKARFAKQCSAVVEALKRVSVLRPIPGSADRYEVSPTLALLVSAEQLEAFTRTYERLKQQRCAPGSQG